MMFIVNHTEFGPRHGNFICEFETLIEALEHMSRTRERFESDPSRIGTDAEARLSVLLSEEKWICKVPEEG